jgi:hypothetical protein
MKWAAMGDLGDKRKWPVHGRALVRAVLKIHDPPDLQSLEKVSSFLFDPDWIRGSVFLLQHLHDLAERPFPVACRNNTHPGTVQLQRAFGDKQHRTLSGQITDPASWCQSWCARLYWAAHARAQKRNAPGGGHPGST